MIQLDTGCRLASLLGGCLCQQYVSTLDLFLALRVHIGQVLVDLIDFWASSAPLDMVEITSETHETANRQSWLSLLTLELLRYSTALG
jgi:hypothetical protein